MSKAFDIFMAGIISGIVAFTTTKLGIGGTILGAVLGSMLYQLMSHYVREPLGKVKTQKIETMVVYVLPLILILGIEIIYVFAPIYWRSEQIFYFLEGATGWNLFRSIGLGLMLMGIYPIFQSENIKKKYGYILLSLGVIVLLRGLLDVDSRLVDIYSIVFNEFNTLISVIVILALIYVVLSILNESITLIKKDEDSDEDNQEDKKDQGDKKESGSD